MTVSESMDVIITKLEILTGQLTDIKVKVDRIAVQDNEIHNMQKELSALWRNIDDLQKPGGTISRIQNHQANCPKSQLKLIWWAIGLLATVFAASLTTVISK